MIGLSTKEGFVCLFLALASVLPSFPLSLPSDNGFATLRDRTEQNSEHTAKPSGSGRRVYKKKREREKENERERKRDRGKEEKKETRDERGCRSKSLLILVHWRMRRGENSQPNSELGNECDFFSACLSQCVHPPHSPGSERERKRARERASREPARKPGKRETKVSLSSFSSFSAAAVSFPGDSS